MAGILERTDRRKVLFLSVHNKAEALDRLLDEMSKSDLVVDPSLLREEILRREAQMSTGLVAGFAAPHATTPGVQEVISVIGILREPIEYGTLDGSRVKVLFMIAAPEGRRGEYFKTLCRLSRLMQDAEFREAIFAAESERDVEELLRR